MDGFELARQIDKLNPDVKLVVITAFYDVVGIPFGLVDKIRRDCIFEKAPEADASMPRCQERA